MPSYEPGLDHRHLSRIDWRIVPIVLSLMMISLLVISSMTADSEDLFWMLLVKSQLRWFLCGWATFALMVSFDYRKFQSLSWTLYSFIILLLIGFFLLIRSKMCIAGIAFLLSD